MSAESFSEPPKPAGAEELAGLVGHRLAVTGNTILADVQKAFHEHTFKFMAIVENSRVTGMCSREKVGDLLGSQFGYSIYAKKLIRDYAVAQPEIIASGTPLREVMAKVFSRPSERFYQDVILVGEKYELMGLIPVDNLVRLQNHMLSDKIGALEESEHRLIRQKAELGELAAKLELANAELESARDTAVEGTKLKSQFLANMSHEIRTPMNGVIGMISLLVETELDEEQKQYCTTIRKSAEALLGLINDILDFSKIEAGRLDVSVEETPIRELVEECVSLLAEGASQKKVELILDIDPAVPEWVEVDPLRYRQVLNNLVGNALKFTEQGEVIVRLRVSREPGKGYFMQTEVQDSGIGIPSDQQKKLFEPFVQGDGSTSRRYGGTGLGLAISRRLSKLMEGDLNCASEPGEGSTFWLTLPLESISTPDPVKAVRPLPDGLRALVVDDHSIAADTLCRQIALHGITCLTAPDARQAMRILREAYASLEPIHYLFVDADLPDSAGQELCRRIAEDADLEATGVVLMTPIGRNLSASERNFSCVRRVLLKPVGPNNLLEALHRAQPKETTAKPEVVATLPPFLPEQKPMRILLAEDSATNQEVAIRLLERLGHTVYLAENGTQVLDILRTEPLDCVLMDCQMPHMDGYEATRAIRQGFHGIQCREIPIVAMTAHAMQGDRQKCLQAGMDDYLSKPVTLERLAQVLHRVAEKASVE